MGSESIWGCINTKSVGKQIILGHDTQILSFIHVPCIAYKCPYLGVWIVSEGVWIKSEWSGGVIIPNMLVKMYKSHASSNIAFSSSAL